MLNFRNTRLYKVASNIKDAPNEGLPEIVLSGKSNVGKSSLINALCDNKSLSRVSSTPGKTRTVLYFNVDRKMLIADLPGYGYAKVSKELKEGFSKLADDYFTSGRGFNLILHLIDIRHNPSKEDIAMLEYMNQMALPYFVIFTKADKLSRAQMMKRIKELEKEFDISEDANVFAVSSSSKLGLDDLRLAISDYLGL